MILELLPDVQRLQPSDKRQLAEELLLEVDSADGIEVDPSILALLDSRLAAYDASPSTVSTWDDVKARVFNRHVS